MDSPSLSALENNTLSLIDLCQKLIEENRSLRCKVIDQEKQIIELINKNTGAVKKIECMINQLKTLEHGE